jgi:hypothetical protein
VAPVEFVEDWLSDRSVLAWKRRERDGMITWSQVDVSTGQEQALPRLTSRITKDHLIPFRVKLSPDRKWLLWTQELRGEAVAVIAAADGSKVYTTPIGTTPGVDSSIEHPVYWGAEDRLWHEFAAESGERVYSKVLVRKFPDRRVLRTVRIAPSAVEGDAYAELRWLRSGRDRFAARPLATGRGVLVTAYEMGREFRVVAVNTHEELKADSTWAEDVSSDGKRLAWFASLDREKKVWLCTADLDGGKVRLLGYLPYHVSRVSGDTTCADA